MEVTRETAPRRRTVELALVNRPRSVLNAGLVVSLLAHVALVLSFVVPPADPRPHRTLGDQFVTFLLPPDRGPGDEARALPWSEVAGDLGIGPSSTTDLPAALAGEPLAERGGGAGESETADSARPAHAAWASLALDSVLTEFDVDSAVQRYPWTTAPSYPPTLLRRGIEGRAFVRFVVDTTGLADTATFRIVDATHPEFARAVRDALPQMRFRPAVRGGVKVRQLVEQAFTFRISQRDTLPRRRSGIPPPVVPAPSDATG